MTLRQQIGLPSTWIGLALLAFLLVIRAEPVVLLLTIPVQLVLRRWIDPIPLLGPDWPPDSN